MEGEKGGGRNGKRNGGREGGGNEMKGVGRGLMMVGKGKRGRDEGMK